MSSSRQPTHRLTFMAFCCRERQGGLAQAGPALSLEGDRCHVGAGVGVGNTLKRRGLPAEGVRPSPGGGGSEGSPGQHPAEEAVSRA